MGVFLQQGLCILGNSQHINLLDKTKPIVQCKPLLPGQSLYWLDASTVDLFESNDAKASLIYNVDYDLMHCRLGHPSKEVLRRAKDHTKVLCPSRGVYLVHGFGVTQQVVLHNVQAKMSIVL